MTQHYFLWFLFFGFVTLMALFLIHMSNQKEPVNRLLLLNLITSQAVASLVILGFLLQEGSLIDMSFIYILLGPIASMAFMLYKKHNAELQSSQVNKKPKLLKPQSRKGQEKG